MAGRRSGGGSFAAKLTPHTTPMQTLKKLGTSALTDEGIRGESWLACLVYLRLPAGAAAILRGLALYLASLGEPKRKHNRLTWLPCHRQVHKSTSTTSSSSTRQGLGLDDNLHHDSPAALLAVRS